MNDKMLLFIPIFNCEKQIVRVLEQLSIEMTSFLSEVILVNNRSVDNSEKVALDYLKKKNFKIPIRILRNDENYGLGGSHKVAFQYAIDNAFDYVIVLHGDDQGEISNILPYLKTKEYQEYDILAGARFMKNSKLKGYSKFRTFGNCVYNFLFSVGTGNKIYDLGSGLNMYKVDILKDKFYLKYKDNLVFNYCMVMGSSFYKHKVKFFPITWKEEDQVSNVKLTSQAIMVLKLLLSYVLNKKKFVQSEHRDRIVEKYSAQIITE